MIIPFLPSNVKGIINNEIKRFFTFSSYKYGLKTDISNVFCVTFEMLTIEP